MKQFLILFFILPSIIVTAQLVEITPDDLVGEDLLGFFIDLKGNELVATASLSDVLPGVEGVVYYYTDDGSGWQVSQKITAQLPEDENGITFGQAISFSDEWMFVALEESNQRESVVVFRKENGTWSRHSKIDGANPDVGFGFSLAVEGNTAIIGSIIDFDDANEATGVAYVYKYAAFVDSWELSQVLSPNGLEIGDFFGSQIHFDGEVLAIAARNDGDNGARSGAVYIYEETQGAWVESAKLTPDDATEENFIGFRIDGDEDQLIISGYGAEEERGASYIYRNDGAWVLEARLDPGLLSSGDWFGSSVAIEGDRAIVGARNSSDFSGSVYVFEKQNMEWTLDRIIDAPEGQEEGRFGAGVDFSEGQMIVSAPWANNLSGQLFSFDLGDSVSVTDAESEVPVLSLYPNPSYDHLTVELDNQEVQEIEILSMMGFKVATYNYQGLPLDVSQLAAGSYLVRATNDGTSVVLGRFVKK